MFQVAISLPANADSCPPSCHWDNELWRVCVCVCVCVCVGLQTSRSTELLGSGKWPRRDPGSGGARSPPSPLGSGASSLGGPTAFLGSAGGGRLTSSLGSGASSLGGPPSSLGGGASSLG